MKLYATVFLLFLFCPLEHALARDNVSGPSAVSSPNAEAASAAPASGPEASGERQEASPNTRQTSTSRPPETPAGQQDAPPAQEKLPSAPPEKGDPLAAARIISIVGENVGKAKRGWVNLEPGARPAYVGIQGGTAPITLLRSSRGSLLGYTGKTGDDFIRLLQGKEAAAEALPPSDSKEALELPLPPPPDLEDFAAPTGSSLFSSSPPLQPFGLSTPEHVVQQEEEARQEPPAVKKTAPAKKKHKKAVPKKVTRPKPAASRPQLPRAASD